MFAFIEKIIGSKNDRVIKKILPKIQKINVLENKIQSLSLEEIKARFLLIGDQVKQGKSLDDSLIEVFALVKEASNRLLGLRHFDVQLLGGIILHEGKIAEMKTGEGKTLVATLPAALNALSGLPVHIVTVNDYLAKRDHGQMSKLFEGLGLSASVIYSGMSDDERKLAYQKQVIYGANNEFGFDYLRKNMALTADDQVMGHLGYAIVDEIDSILIDEARTPLIISGQSEDSSKLYQQINLLVKELNCGAEDDQNADYVLDHKSKSATLTEKGYEVAENLFKKSGLLGKNNHLHDAEHLNLMHHLDAAMRAHGLYFNNQHYIVRQGQAVIIDEFTGRAMAGRRWSDGLHQAIEAKECISVSPENKTLASITYQNFFLLYKKISGMTGTAATEANEFRQIYGLEVLVAPTNKPMIRQDHSDQIYGTLKEKFHMLIEEIKKRHANRQPILIGTASIDISEKLSIQLKKAGLSHQVLNAKHHEKEAKIIAQAGCIDAITIATNMAGRGTDIVLGGNLNVMIDQLGENPDQQLIDELKSKWEGLHQQVIDVGGLCILGTEHHESRRIDNQLRGRSGRQGDPGETRFYVSLEDELLRIFASDRMRAVLQGLGIADNQSIEHPMINRSIANAQKRVEAHHFGVRKNLLEFDNVSNYQRRVFYKKRELILATKALNELIFESIESWIKETVSLHFPEADDQWNWQAVIEMLNVQSGCDFSDNLTVFNSETKEDEAIQVLAKQAKEFYQQRLEQSKDLDQFQSFYRMAALQLSDMLWVEHLRSLDHLKQGVYLQAYAQKNPIQEYKHQSFIMLERFEGNWQVNIGRLALALVLPDEKSETPHLKSKPPTSQNSFDSSSEKKKLGRNDPCFCDSGKKYKHCHGKL